LLDRGERLGARAARSNQRFPCDPLRSLRRTMHERADAERLFEWTVSRIAVTRAIHPILRAPAVSVIARTGAIKHARRYVAPQRQPHAGTCEIVTLFRHKSCPRDKAAPRTAENPLRSSRCSPEASRASRRASHWLTNAIHPPPPHPVSTLKSDIAERVRARENREREIGKRCMANIKRIGRTPSEQTSRPPSPHRGGC